MSGSILASVATPWILAFVARLTAIFALGFVATTLMRRSSAAMRHLAWTMTMAASLLLVPATFLAPAIDVTVPGEFFASILAPAKAPTPAPEIAVVDAFVPEFETVARISAARTSVAPARPAAGSGAPAITFTFWLTGALALLAFYALGHAGLARLARRASAIEEPAWRSLLRSIAERMRVRRDIRLARSKEVGTPITWRAAQPMILVPGEADEWTEERRRVVLLHEVAHIARLDYVTQLVSAAACSLYWMHPLVWLAARRMRAESERAADDRVIAAGTAPTDYATHLLNVARSALALRLTGAVAIGMARKSTLEGRMLALLDDRRDRRSTSRTARLIAVAAGFFVLVGAASLRPVSPMSATQTQGGRETESERPELRTAENEQQGKGFQRTIEVSGQTELSIDLRTGGFVHIIGWDQPRVRIQGKLVAEREGEQEVSAVEERGRIVLRSRSTGRNLSPAENAFEIHVPLKFNLTIESAGGELNIRDVSGTFRGNISAGQIVLEGVSGRAELSTGDGQVMVVKSQLEGTVATSRGDVELLGVSGSLQGLTSKGDVRREEASRFGSKEGAVFGPEGKKLLELRGTLRKIEEHRWDANANEAEKGRAWVGGEAEKLRALRADLKRLEAKLKEPEVNDLELDRLAETVNAIKELKESEALSRAEKEAYAEKAKPYFEFMVEKPVADLWPKEKPYSGFTAERPIFREKGELGWAAGCDDGSGVSVEALSRTARKLYPAEYEATGGRSTKMVGLIFDSNCQLLEHTARDRMTGAFTDEQALERLFPRIGRVKWKVSGFSGVSKDGRGDPIIVWGVKPKE